MKICGFCQKEFEEKSKKQKFCSLHCYFNFPRKSNRIKRSCKLCGKEYEVTPSKKDIYTEYCSLSCRKKSSLVKKTCEFCRKDFEIKRWESKNKKFCSRECYQKQRASIIFEKTCLFCGKNIITNKSRKQFCNKTCFLNWLKNRNIKESICLKCGKIFIGKTKTKEYKYCSVECFQSTYSVEKEEHECPICKKKFQSPKSKPQKYCCKACSILGLKTGKKERKFEKTCLVCGTKFLAIFKGKKYCSTYCRKHVGKTPKLFKKICPECGKEYQVRSGKKDQIFCSTKCVQNHRKVEFKRRTPHEKRTMIDGICKGNHRWRMEHYLGRKLETIEEVHHIDMDRNNNNLENLYVYNGKGAHHLGHGTINKLVKPLLEKGVIIFDNGVYKLNPLYFNELEKV